MSELAIGIDLGGTNLRVCLLDENGRRLADDFSPVPPNMPGEAIVSLLTDRVRAMSHAARPVGIGVGLAGRLDRDGRLIGSVTNLPGLAGLQFADALERAAGLPCRVENDACAAILGEQRFGAARGVGNALLLTLGTGVGGALVLDGKLRSGPRGFAGEAGLIVVPNPDAARSWLALEDVAAPGRLQRNRGIVLADQFPRAVAGDPEAKAEIERVCQCLALAIINCHVVLDLELILLSGGMTRAGQPLLNEIRAAFNRLCPSAVAGPLAIEFASLGEWAGAVGAATLWLERGGAKAAAE